MLAIILATSLLLNPKCVSCPRDSHGRIARSAAAKRAFRQAHPCPSTGRTTGACPGWVVDHVKPLACLGPDTPANMRWEEAGESKDKDRTEYRGCLR